jgi:hypothetical protein
MVETRPSGTFSARIKTVYVLGLITELEFQESATIRRVSGECRRDCGTVPVHFL